MTGYPTLRPLRHHEVEPQANPTGEELLDRSVRPYKIWSPSRLCIVLGNSQSPEKEVKVENVAADGIPLFKRMGGGGTVLLSPGCLCLGLRFAKRKELAIQDYFAMGSGVIQRAVASSMGLELEPKGISDLACGERKVAGCSLYMPRDFVLYLASLLVDPDLTEIEKYLAYPSQAPEYRSGRLHRDFLAGLKELSTSHSVPETLAASLETEIVPGLRDELDWVPLPPPAA